MLIACANFRCRPGVLVLCRCALLLALTLALKILIGFFLFLFFFASGFSKLRLFFAFFLFPRTMNFEIELIRLASRQTDEHWKRVRVRRECELAKVQIATGDRELKIHSATAAAGAEQTRARMRLPNAAQTRPLRRQDGPLSWDEFREFARLAPSGHHPSNMARCSLATPNCLHGSP